MEFKQVTEVMMPLFGMWPYGLPLFMLVYKPPQLWQSFIISIIQFLSSATAEYVVNHLSQLNIQ